ncbi:MULTISPECIES: polynucleotide adenylyltransferase PcnB [unclassified Oceanispirochaeta]|uniref:polynucleotide adenylyltransferase PcnB n=1 Tax=unclassified Oceanispirochaeta TaxID=2635722 RepID=UPI000E09BDF6|nr:MULTISPECIES: polynucleotide adenylyltransferase PcnB [unclassified Oceanispirochaeta]MBF9015746.1 polynucleotide adenylyltransferase PcnB [Oceanispirochaeta sp. M2]NPD72209.1 polynucleotide adenylyltransferase PcnB [Oceanispirochaeta sp. M1]RDG32308.1 polynucleotide adenylyltransferase PcnB [Oceanispirochaeta sp. M1]
MLIRYGKNSKGRLIKQAKVYTLDEHGISRRRLDHDALKVTDRLRTAGYQAYVVGGAVRDLLIDKAPKDYDIATDASPTRVRKIFRNSRIIGKRFRLVHVYFPQNKILEVATFRSLEGGEGDNVYGAMDEDAKRRDFTLNALYYSPREEQIIDYHDGVKDIKNRKLRSVIPLDVTFKEDPVRMLRAVKYSVMTNARIPFSLRRAIKRDAPLLLECSVSRMSEEIFKILQSGYSESIIQTAEKLNLFEYLLPRFHKQLNGPRGRTFTKKFYRDLQKLDKYIKIGDEEKTRGKMLNFLCRGFLAETGALDGGDETSFSDTINAVKEALRPMIAPNRDVMDGVKLVFKQNNWKIPRKRPPFKAAAQKGIRSKPSKTGSMSQKRKVIKPAED